MLHLKNGIVFTMGPQGVLPHGDVLVENGKIVAVGENLPEQGGEVYEESDGEHLKRLFLRDGRLVGYILIGAVERAGIYTYLIRSRTPLAEIDFENLKKNPNLSAFPSIYRRKILGGVV